MREGRKVRMHRAALAALSIGCVAVSILSGSPQSVYTQRAFLEKYCLSCHSESSKEKGLVPIALEKLDLSRVGKDAEIWEKVIRKMDAGVMPPPSAPRPDRAAS